MKMELPDIVKIGIYNSAFSAKNKVITTNRKTTMFEIEIPIEEGGVSYIGTDKMSIEPNMVICAKPGQTRYTKLPFKCYYIHFILTDGKLYDRLMAIPNYVKTNKHEKYYEIFQKMFKYHDRTVDTNEIILHSLILELIHTLMNDARKPLSHDHIKRNHYKAIENAIQYIKENLASELSLETIAKQAGFSPVHFHKVFKAATHQTLHEYVEGQRIKKAANMLVTTDDTLAEIAYECGFSSQSYFSYAFKRKMKKTPREYAKEVFARYEE